jgi:hypothetical protein
VVGEDGVSGIGYSLAQVGTEIGYSLAKVGARAEKRRVRVLAPQVVGDR